MTLTIHIENTDLTARLDDLPVLFKSLQLDTLTAQDRQKVAQIDATLPQTQCGLCGHHDGCLPYACGIIMHNEPTNLCIPGGQVVADQIAAIIGKQSLAATPSKWQTHEQTGRPIEVRAVIDEPNCIGCTKCIPACPVDAIIGTAKHMHSIIKELCTGCELCLTPCPVDCIDLVEFPRVLSDDERQNEQEHLRRRYHQHLNRVAKTITEGAKPVVSAVESAMANALMPTITPDAPSENLAKNTVELAKIRTQIKKLTKQLSVRYTDDANAKLLQLQDRLKQLSS
ncbi:RnfABCDGE type electron transport complex subunit B [Moraxella nasovis]|uniref:RnfABCDGE type electron transport complex subunit B n=1 Tax=Moraxella nasovis TaxID=2904121 RepID=UPI001F600E86|nr:RnfABCDGE type electron transport complex subunit B [Moraxella nasovis]UNU73323.1 RnfABCDGE type electron transport complex subunit B [Moraxella nasovis]